MATLSAPKTSSTRNRWEFEDEARCAEKIQAAEIRLREALADVEVARPLLEQKPSKVERTRGGAVERLKEAAELLVEAAKEDTSLAPAARQARGALAELEAHQWELAMSAVHVAHVEARRLKSPFLNHDDLVQEGYIGLLRAAQRFDPARKIRFSTYARWWVRAQVIRSIETKGRMVRLPGGAVEVIRKMRTLRQRYAQEGIQVDVESLAEEVGLEVSRARELLQFEGGLHGQDVDIDNEDHPIQIAHEDELQDLAIERHQAFQKVMGVIESRLDDRERFILEQRYGLKGEHRTMSDIGDELGISRERVRQIQATALAFLRSVAFEDAAA